MNHGKTRKPSTRAEKFETIVALLTAFSLFFVFSVSCSRPIEGDDITLLFPSIVAGKAASVNADFKEEDCIVLRCSSFTSNEREIVARVSKSKDLKATILIFVNPNGISGNAEQFQIAVANVTGKEYEYDITTARLYQVTTSSAEAAIENYGIAYSDWQTGAVNSSEKFPCCE